MSDERSSYATDIGDLMSSIEYLRTQISGLRTQISGLELAYRRAGEDVRLRVSSDVNDIHELKAEAERLVVLLRGGTLFGRYATDADAHQRIANRWRGAAVAILVGAFALEIVLALRYPALGWQEIAALAIPLGLLFTYCSVESYNHRRREFDRRRIYLRMAAIESYVTPTTPLPAMREESYRLLDDFIRWHFIEPDLDSNDLDNVGARGLGPLSPHIRRRKSPQGSGKTDGVT